jgi:hypothetical protein
MLLQFVITCQVDVITSVENIVGIVEGDTYEIIDSQTPTPPPLFLANHLLYHIMRHIYLCFYMSSMA